MVDQRIPHIGYDSSWRNHHLPRPPALDSAHAEESYTEYEEERLRGGLSVQVPGHDEEGMREREPIDEFLDEIVKACSAHGWPVEFVIAPSTTSSWPVT